LLVSKLQSRIVISFSLLFLHQSQLVNCMQTVTSTEILLQKLRWKLISKRLVFTCCKLPQDIGTDFLKSNVATQDLKISKTAHQKLT